jgi:flagellin-specific chaperone FliS
MNRQAMLDTLIKAVTTLMDQTDELLLTEEFIGDEDLEEFNEQLTSARDILTDKIEVEQEQSDEPTND